MGLRPYQIDAIERLRAVMRLGKRRVVLVSPTGSGKTKMLSEIARRCIESGRRALWLAHRSELIDQAVGALKSEGLIVGAICASAESPPNPYAPIQVASVQTLLARNTRPPADMIFADECHHFALAAETFSALLNSYAESWTIGATATPERGDGCGLKDNFDALVVGATVRQLTDDGYLVPCEVLRPDKPLEPGKIAQNPVDAYVEHAVGVDGTKRRTIVFCKSVALAEQYAGEFVTRGFKARALSAETPWPERRMTIDALRNGGLDVVTNVMVATEGLDAPEVSCVILARGCGSAGMYLQMIGRALRPAPGKRDAVLLDLRGVSHEHGRPDDEREFSLDGRGIRLRDPQSYCPVCGAPRTPPDPCTSCGYEGSRDELGKPDKVVGVKLVPYAHLREDDDATRARRLARWIQASRAKGYKDGFWRAKYNAVYGAYPTAAIVEKAREVMAGREEAVA